VGRPVEVRAPNVTLESGAAQEIVSNYRWNAFGQLVAEIDPEGYLSAYAYYPENAPYAGSAGTTPNPPGRTLSSTTGGYLAEVVRDDSTALRTPAVSASRVEATTSFAYDEVGNVVAQ